MSWSIEEAIKRTGVTTEGHFIFTSGRHSHTYMQCAQLLQYPQEAEQAGKAIAALFADVSIDLVVGPALGGLIIAHEVARALGVRCIFAERKEGVMQIRRGFEVKPGERILVVEDVVTTGGSVMEVIRLLEEKDAQIVGVGSIVDRSRGQHPFTQFPFRALTQIDIESYPPEECPLCKEGKLPAIKPGSRGNA